MPREKKDEDRRAAQRLCKRRKYAKIKNDPDLYEIAREKRRQKYLKDKEDNKIKNISDQSLRAQREQRKKWREHSKTYRQRKRDTKQVTFENVQTDAIPVSDGKLCESNEDPLNFESMIRKVRYQELKKRMKLMRVILAYKKRDKTLCRQIQRLKKKIIDMDTSIRDTSKSKITNFNTVNLSSTTATSPIKIKSTSTPTIERIKNFYLHDANSNMTPGKKQYITRNQIRMQKRILSHPLNYLYKKFLLETSARVSYSFFCRHRPFWVVFPKNTDRDTCQCLLHNNMELLIKSLNKFSIIKEKNCDQVISKLTCNSRNLDCLERLYNRCKSRVIDYEQFSNNANIIYFEWKKIKKEMKLRNGTKKRQMVTEKVRCVVEPLDAIGKFEANLLNFFKHLHKIVSQYKSITNLKENLNLHEACVHVDFSENYLLKFGTEVQSFHFGGSRQQVSLHTAVIYAHSFVKVMPTSMCTISDCLRHDASAIWAHLIPLIEECIRLNPFIDTIHFLSDSPTSQYRNKYMFFLISQIYKDFSQIVRITWNYSEVGHGKGAPDGVGATIKRTADRMVLYGKDIGTFDQFCDLLQNEDLNIVIKKVNETEVKLKESLIPNNLKAFRGTFVVYQVLWEKSAQKTSLRTLSCFECEASKICEHGKHLGFIKNPVESEKENVSQTISIESEVVPLIATKHRVKILSDITINMHNAKDFVPHPSTSKNH